MEEEAVSYRIFPNLDEVEKGQPGSSSVKGRLEELKRQCLSVVCPIVEGYIWQHEPFNLQVHSSLDEFLLSGKRSRGRNSVDESEKDRSVSDLSSADAFVPHLAGKVKFGDNLEDEWLVVYLLLEISRRFSSVSITVRDTDGEFLLIESSFCLPSWLGPENTHNRIFIRQGAVHMLPISRSTARSRKASGHASLNNSLQELAGGSIDTRASPEVQNVILERLAGYPQKAQKNVHRVRCKVPLPVAHILAHEPQLIALAVESFYTRDMDSMKAASRMEKFLPKDKDGRTELVDTVVPMSRAMYAQLVQQVFQAPRSYPMLPLSSPAFKEAEIGMKIAVGFEMMYWERSPSELLDSVAPEGLENLEFVSSLEESPESINGTRKAVPKNDAAWQRYRASLEKSGYFRGLLEGSKEHRELLQAAVAQYRSTNVVSRASTAMNAPVIRIAELLSMPYNVEDFLDAGSKPSDDDRWLYDGEEDLAAVMLQRQNEMDAYESKQEKRKSAKKSSASASDQKLEDLETFHATEVVRSMQSFVDKVSSFEGAEIPDKDNENFADDEAVDLDMSRLMKELEAVFDPKEIASMLSEGLAKEDSDSSSDISLDDNTSGSEDEMELDDNDVAQLKDSASSNGAVNAIDEEKDEHAIFRDEYSDVLDEQLKTSSLAKSFAKRREVVPIDDAKGSGADSKKAECQPPAVENLESEPDDGNSNDLVDVDVNLVESLLRSFMFQQGMPGPASNLLGAMGVELPDNGDARPGSSERLKKSIPKWKETVIWETCATRYDDDEIESSSENDN